MPIFVNNKKRANKLTIIPVKQLVQEQTYLSDLPNTRVPTETILSPGEQPEENRYLLENLIKSDEKIADLNNKLSEKFKSISNILDSLVSTGIPIAPIIPIEIAPKIIHVPAPAPIPAPVPVSATRVNEKKVTFLRKGRGSNSGTLKRIY